MAIFKELSAQNIKTQKSYLNQLIDVLQEDISGSLTRRAYQLFVTGGVGPGVTSSLYQTVYDQDFTLQSANPVMDMTVGIFGDSDIVTGISLGEDSAGKSLFPSTSLMMREKVAIYRQHALTLLGDRNARFSSPFGSTATSDQIDAALIINFKRLFTRDGIRPETFAMRMYSEAETNSGQANTNITSEQGAKIFTDSGAASSQETTFGGKVSNLVEAGNTSVNVGLLFNDYGILVLDMNRAINGAQEVSGAISAMSPLATPDHSDVPAGRTLIGQGGGNPNAKFVPDLMTSGSIDDIVDILAETRFSSGTLTSIAFQNQTVINSSLVFCEMSADEFNYSSNPTYTDEDGRIVVIDPGQEDVQSSFTMLTSVGLYDANNTLLAVAKMSRPLEKGSARSLTVRLRLDF